jgi:hypothetical protein
VPISGNPDSPARDQPFADGVQTSNTGRS